MNCQMVDQLAAPYLDGELGQAQREELERHLRGCDACHGALARMQAASARLRESLRAQAGYALPSQRSGARLQRHLRGRRVAMGSQPGGIKRWPAPMLVALTLFSLSVVGYLAFNVVGLSNAPLATPSLSGGVAASTNTWLYLSGFDLPEIVVYDPQARQVVHTEPISGQFPGLAVSPDGARLYLLEADGFGYAQLRVLETRGWSVIYQQRIADTASLLSGNPLTLSPDGRWLFVSRYSYAESRGWTSVFDTATLELGPDDPRFAECAARPRLAGAPRHPRLYLACNGTLYALDAQTRQELWSTPIDQSFEVDLELSPDEARLYALLTRGPAPGTLDDPGKTSVQLFSWESGSGRPFLRGIELKEGLFNLAEATIGRGDQGYIEIAPNGETIYIGWEDKILQLTLFWNFDRTESAFSLDLDGETLPAPAGGMELSVDGEQLYLVPATAGDLKVRGKGLWVVDASTLKLEQIEQGFPADLRLPVVLAAPAGE